MTDEKVNFKTINKVMNNTELIPKIGIGLLGYAFMGKTHSNAYLKMPYIFWPPPAIPRLVAICGRTTKKVKEAAKRFGYKKYYTDWRHLVKDPNIELFDNGAPNNLHEKPCIEAAENGKHILCEKPLGITADESKRMVNAIKKSGVKAMAGFNYRFIPAILLAKKLIEEGEIGRIYHFQAKYLQEWIMDPNYPMEWRLEKKIAGSGVLGDLGSHIIDLAHFLVGNISSITAITRTFIDKRPTIEDPNTKEKVDVDDAFESIVEFDNGAIGTISSSRFCAGRANYQVIEIYGSKGSIIFNLEKLNMLRVHLIDHNPRDLKPSYHDTLVTEEYHPYMDKWWGHGHIIGWEHTHIHQIHHLIKAIINDESIAPGATFEDGYKCAIVCDAVLESAISSKKIILNY